MLMNKKITILLNDAMVSNMKDYGDVKYAFYFIVYFYFLNK